MYMYCLNRYLQSVEKERANRERFCKYLLSISLLYKTSFFSFSIIPYTPDYKTNYYNNEYYFKHLILSIIFMISHIQYIIASMGQL